MKPLTLADKLDAAEAGRVLPYSFEGKPSEALLKWGHDMGYAVNARTGFFEPESQQDEPATA